MMRRLCSVVEGQRVVRNDFTGQELTRPCSSDLTYDLKSLEIVKRLRAFESSRCRVHPEVRSPARIIITPSHTANGITNSECLPYLPRSMHLPNVNLVGN